MGVSMIYPSSENKYIYKAMKKGLFLLLYLCILAIESLAQTSMCDFMEKNGFSKQRYNKYINSRNDTLEVEGNYVVRFTSVQTHNWTLVFGDGKSLGGTIDVSVGDTISFADGTLQLQDKSLISFDCPRLRRGIIKSPIFNNQRTSVNITDIKTEQEPSEHIGIYSPSNGMPHRLDTYGNFEDAKERKDSKDQKLLSEINEEYENQKEERAYREYERLCKQYGTAKVDGVIRGEFATGVPIDLIYKFQRLRTTHRVIRDNGSTVTVRFTPLMYPTQGFFNIWEVTYNSKTNIVLRFRTLRTTAKWL